jgi:poly(A) polymerase
MPLFVKEYLKPVIEPEASRLLTEISHFLAVKKIPAYIVGGMVRDFLLGRSTADIDIAVSTDALETARSAAIMLGGTYVELDDMNRIGRVVLADKRQIDFSTLAGDIENDLGRRDFTIDAMAIELKNKLDGNAVIIDPFNGQADLNKRIIRAVSDGIFQDDPARLLRTVRLAAELGFKIEKDTETLIKRDSRRISRVAGERIREELLRLLVLPGAGERLFYLDKAGLLTELFPELNAGRGIDQPPVHYWDILTHAIQTITAVEFVLRESKWDYAGEEVITTVPWSDELKSHFDREISRGSTARTMLKMAALFHDIAKPQTKTMDGERARFLGHPEQGAAAAVEIMTRLRFSNREIRLVELLVKNHMRPTQMCNEGLPTKRAIYRFFRDTGEAGIDLLFLCLADHLATRAATLDKAGWEEHTGITAYVLKKRDEETKLAAPVKLINGKDIMQSLGLSPGPEVGKLLEALKEARATGEVSTRAEALKYLRRLFRERTKNITILPGEKHDKK